MRPTYINDFNVSFCNYAVINDEELKEALEQCEPYIFKGYNDLGELLFIEIDLLVMKDSANIKELKALLMKTEMKLIDIRNLIDTIKVLIKKKCNALQVYD